MALLPTEPFTQCPHERPSRKGTDLMCLLGLSHCYRCRRWTKAVTTSRVERAKGRENSEVEVDSMAREKVRAVSRQTARHYRHMISP